jgi:chromosome segregation ATPase
MTRYPYLCFLLLATMVLASAPAFAQSETDRLREALRGITGQLRALEDQRATMQAKQVEAERDRERLKTQNQALRAQVKDAEQAYRQAVKDFNDRIAERDQVLDQWKSQYGEAANVVRSKEAALTKATAEAASFKASNKACEAKNAELVKLSDQIVLRYKEMNPLEKVLDHEPVFGLKRVEHENEVQDYQDKITSQKAKP